MLDVVLFTRMSSRYFDDKADSSDGFFSQWGGVSKEGPRKNEYPKPDPDFYISSKTSLDDRSVESINPATFLSPNREKKEK